MAPFEDRLSQLHSSILVIILSLLPVKDAVRTSLLAKQWRSLWLALPNVVLDDRVFGTPLNGTIDQDHPNYTIASHNHKYYQQSRCLDFGTKWLTNATTKITSFSLTFSDPQNMPINLNKLLTLALKCEPKSLELEFSDPSWVDKLPISNLTVERFQLPEFIYEYNLLESLKLVSCLFDLTKLTTLGRNIKSVTLAWVRIETDLTLLRIVQKFPLLQHLCLSKCFHATNYAIHSNTLTTLIIEKCVDLFTLSINAPNLTHFKYCGGTLRLDGLYDSKLERAELDFGLVGRFDVEGGDIVAYVLYNLSMARSLIVCSYVTQMLPFAWEDILYPARNKARRLTIKTSFYKRELMGIVRMLDFYPLLEEVRFNRGADHIDFEKDMIHNNIHENATKRAAVRPSAQGCVPSNLKVVEFVGFQGSLTENEVIAFFVGCGRGLKKLIIRAGNRRGLQTAKGIMDILPTIARENQREMINVEIFSENGVMYRARGGQ